MCRLDLTGIKPKKNQIDNTRTSINRVKGELRSRHKAR